MKNTLVLETNGFRIKKINETLFASKANDKIQNIMITVMIDVPRNELKIINSISEFYVKEKSFNCVIYDRKTEATAILKNAKIKGINPSQLDQTTYTLEPEEAIF